MLQEMLLRLGACYQSHREGRISFIKISSYFRFGHVKLLISLDNLIFNKRARKHSNLHDRWGKTNHFRISEKEFILHNIIPLLFFTQHFRIVSGNWIYTAKLISEDFLAEIFLLNSSWRKEHFPEINPGIRKWAKSRKEHKSHILPFTAVIIFHCFSLNIQIIS